MSITEELERLQSMVSDTRQYNRDRMKANYQLARELGFDSYTAKALQGSSPKKIRALGVALANQNKKGVK